MPHYQLRISGENYLFAMHGVPERFAFYVNRNISAADATAARELALGQVRNDADRRGLLLNQPDNQPTLIVEEVREVEAFDTGEQQGLTWYPMLTAGDGQAHSAYQRRLRFYRWAWLLWIVGMLIIVLSWIDLVSPTISWIGFGIALAGTVLSLLANLRLRSPSA